MTTQEMTNIDEETLRLVRKWGGDNTDAILDPSCLIFTSPEVEGLIGYRTFSNCAVVIGDPVCDFEKKGILASIFYEELKKKNFALIFVSTSKEFAEWANKTISPIAIEWGEKLTLDPFNNPYDGTGHKASLVRRKVKQAIREGTTIHEYRPDTVRNENLENALVEVGDKWLKGRERPQVHISNIHLFSNCYGKRWIYALKNDEIVGIVVLNQIEAYRGWLINHLMITDDASNGTPELLINSALKTLQEEGCHFITFGATPHPEVKDIKGMGMIPSILTRIGYKFANKIFHFDGLKVFWGKFQPDSQPSYLLFSEKSLKPQLVYALMKALNVSIK